MSKVLIIGAGGVSNVVVRKCAQNHEVYSEILLASRTKAKCDAIAKDIKNIPIQTAAVNADHSEEVAKLIRDFKPELVINVALPYQDLAIMDACLKEGVNYLDTANYEPKDVAHFEYSWQWAYHERFKEAGIMALLGSGFDPGMTNVYTAYAKKHYFDRMDTLDIVDCNAGNHGKAFATNFNPEINIREITQPGRFYKDGAFHEIPAMSEHQAINYPEVGDKESYVLFHEELESLVKHFPELKQARFWMTFGTQYLNYLDVLQNVGMTRIDPVKFKGVEIVPLEFLKAVLPEPGSLGENYSGKTCIGCQVTGEKDGKPQTYFVYNVSDHAESYKEVKAQAISYTTGVPAMLGGAMILRGIWKGKGVFNMEQFDPDPFMAEIGKWGLPWQEMFGTKLV
ncbi:MAG: saccharopine dehydrogenase family protein [Fibrobacter sp.]|jgi:saccharopine dehydrogenase (NAD+, L-lysine-forming)|nr:saccharopine dehydrogenase family protein [Fibrobacter sp.]